MSRRPTTALRERTLDELSIDDEPSFRHVALYGDLKAILLRDRYVFRVLPGPGRWDRALFLNLTYWGGTGGDVLESERVPADVVAHAAWHHLAAEAAGIVAGRTPSAEALFLGESIASAFDIYLVGRLLGRAPRSSFLETQVSAMAQAASAAGLAQRGFASLLAGVARDPEGAFADLRRLLYDTAVAMRPCRRANDALRTLARFETHRFAPLLHHYELSNWVLHAAAYAGGAPASTRRARGIDATLRVERDPLAWLTTAWVAPALARARRRGSPARRRARDGDGADPVE
jgi:hypothetical protein